MQERPPELPGPSRGPPECPEVQVDPAQRDWPRVTTRVNGGQARGPLPVHLDSVPAPETSHCADPLVARVGEALQSLLPGSRLQ